MTGRKQQIYLFLVAIGWLLIFLRFSQFRPSYLVEGTMNYLNFEFASKEAYVATVEWLRSVYRVYLVALVAFTVWVLGKG